MSIKNLGTDDGLFFSLQTILKSTDEYFYFDRVRETYGLTRSRKISISPIQINGNKMKYSASTEFSGKHFCDVDFLYEKLTNTDLKMTMTCDDVIGIREFKKVAE